MIYPIINKSNLVRSGMYLPIFASLTIHMALRVPLMMPLLLSILPLISTLTGFLKGRSLHGQILLTPSTNAQSPFTTNQLLSDGKI